MSQDIGIVFEDFFDQIRALSGQIRDFPAPAALRTTDGANTGAAVDFKAAMVALGDDLSALGNTMRAELEGVESLMRAAAADLAETDAAAAETARAVLVQLEGIPDAPTPKHSAAPLGPVAGAIVGAAAGAKGTLK